MKYDRNSIVDFLKRNLPRGSVAGNEFNADCPSPDCENPHNHFYVNLLTGRFICFHCTSSSHPFQGSLETLKRFFKDAEEFTKELPSPDNILEEVKELMSDAKGVQEDIDLPEEYRTLWGDQDHSVGRTYFRMAFRYVLHRHIQQEEIGYYKLGYCADGKFGGRIICPVIEDGRIVYFTARSIFKIAERKILNPLGPRGSLIYNHQCIDDDHDELVICEGPFSSMAVGCNAVSILGRSISLPQLKKISRFKGNKIIVMLDADAGPASLMVAEKIHSLVGSRMLVEVALLPHSDPSDLVGQYGRDGLWDHTEVLQFNLQNMVRLRMLK